MRMALRYEKDIFEKYLKNPNHPLLITIKKPPLNGSTLYVGISTVNDNPPFITIVNVTSVFTLIQSTNAIKKVLKVYV